MSTTPPPTPGYSSPARPSTPPVRTAPYLQPQLQAPTLLQFWRSDSRVLPGRRPARWAGLIAFWVGLLAFGLLVAEMFLDLGDGVLGFVAVPLSLVAGFFAIVALVAGIGRLLGFFGAVFALLGNVYVWGWLSEAFA